MHQKQWVERDDSVPGYIYLIQAEGFHGKIESCFVKRCKIGLTRNIQNRLEQLEGSQPPCNYKVIRTICVDNMALVEGQLHRQFKHCAVKLRRSREWFDFSPWQFLLVNWAFSQCDRAINARDESRALAAKVLVGSGLAILIATAASGQFQQKPEAHPAANLSVHKQLLTQPPRQIQKNQSSRLVGR